MMLNNGSTPIMREITSMRNLSPSQRRRLSWLKEVFRKERRIPLGTSRFEMRYLYRLDRGRRLYKWRKGPSISDRKEWEESMKEANPYWDRPIEEIFKSFSRKNVEQDGVSEK